MYYRAGILIPPDKWLTVHGVKELQGGRGRNSIAEAFALRTILRHGEPDFNRPSDEDWEQAVTEHESRSVIAAGILHMTVSGLAGTLASFRPKARTRIGGAAAMVSFWETVAGGIADVYLSDRASRGRLPAREARLNHELAEAVLRDPAAAELRADGAAAAQRRGREVRAAQPPPQPEPRRTVTEGLEVDTFFLLPDSDGASLVRLRRLRRENARWGHKGPVVLLAGSSVNSDVFRPVGVQTTIVDRLLEKRYDVWLEDWRGSLGCTPREYSLDEAAVIDHRAAIAFVAKKTRKRDIKAVVHCLGSSGFMLALASGLLCDGDEDVFNVTHVVSNAVSLHPMVPPGAVKKIRAFAPIGNRVQAYMDPRWARDVPMLDKQLPTAPDAFPVETFPAMAPKTPLGRLLVAWVKLTHHECDNSVCNFAQFMYGVGPSTLYDEAKLTKETAQWMQGQFGWAPARLYRQLARSILAGHLVPMQQWPGNELGANLFEAGPKDLGTKITFMVGTRNRTFSPTSQLMTYQWFSAHHDHPQTQYKFVPLEDFGHLDVWLAKDQSKVQDVVLEGLSR